MATGLLYPGSMGALVGAALAGPVLWASAGRSAATAERAAAAGLEDAGSLEQLARRADLVLSVCPPAVAEEVARAVAAAGFEGLYVDANAVSPARMAAIEALHPGRTVDGGIVAKQGIHLYLSGAPAQVEAVALRFRGDGEVEPRPLDGPVGVASAFKLAFSGWNKIGLVLAAQAWALARAYGVEGHLEDEGVTPERVPGAAARAWRWGPELDELATTLAGVGLPDGIAHGAAEALARWERHRDRTVPLETLLDDLGRPPA